MLLFWDEPPPRQRGAVKPENRPLPAIPDTGWFLPEGPDAFPDLSGQGMIAVDVETHDPDLLARGPGAYRDGYIAGISIGTEAGFRQYYPVAHQTGPNLPKNTVFKWVEKQLRLPVPKVGANLLYDLEFLQAAGIDPIGPFWDVQVAEPLLDENRLSYALEVLSKEWLGEGKESNTMLQWLEDAFGPKGVRNNIWRAPATVVGPYAESDVDRPLRIFKKQRVQLEAQGLWKLFELESNLIPMLLAMRKRGVPVDVANTEKTVDVLRHSFEAQLDEIKRQSSIRPDVWSAESLASVFDKLDVTYPRTKQTDRPSFTKKWLQSHRSPIAQTISEARRLDKFIGTFLEGYILRGHVNGRIHAQFNPLRGEEGGAVTGRFSSSHPNLQNIPKATDKSNVVRSLFLPEEGHMWWKLDWSQIEYRLMVHFAGVLNLRGADETIARYQNDAATDYHQAVADMIGGSRDDAKSINFGIAYGLGVDNLCYALGVSREEGMEILDNYHRKAPFMKKLSEHAKKRAESNGEVVTLLGRRRRFEMWEKGSKMMRSKEPLPGAKRAFTYAALNAGIQGSAADIMKKAMLDIWESGVCDVIGAPHLTVHDELDGSVDAHSSLHMEAYEHVKHIMENCVTLKVPLLAEGGLGLNWGSIQ